MSDKTYDPSTLEAEMVRVWRESGVFRAGRRGGEPYCIVIPPPNVTGSLHMGHALNATLQDILVRFERMRGRDVLWQPGTDHAGIATQMVVERHLGEEGASRTAIGREAFEARVWAWKERSGDQIGHQLRRLGCSCDWERERFTLDEGLSRAVVRVFVELHREGLIYRDRRLVNWDTRLGTAVSDLEVAPREVRGQLWYVRYPIEGERGRYITIATTRPETMFADAAVAVHPDDGRHGDLVGRHALLPLAGRRLAIIADTHADPAIGSGAVKISPGHDFDDFAIGRAHGLEMINVFDAHGALNDSDSVPAAFRGLDRFVARARVVEALEAGGFLEKVEEHVHMAPYGDRSDTVLEPWLTDQWYVDAKALAGAAIEAVRKGETVFVPERWAKVYFEWLENIQPWCISRQLWWGHRIPVWYGPDGHGFAAHDEAEARALARERYGDGDVEIIQDADVLDTWFSSALWPFSTLGWPEDTPELARYYPTSVLVTGFDIIFFWVARMMMMGKRFMGSVPFRRVYVHALVRDAEGRKMSKSKGNVMDPLELVERYGADALRFTLAAMASPGRDVKLREERVRGYRNFATKVWNAARFCDMHGCAIGGEMPEKVRHVYNRWLLSESAGAARRVTAALEAFRFDGAAEEAYRYVWRVLCDWYLEFIKPLLEGDDGVVAEETRRVAGYGLAMALRLLHPFMPFVTEALWGRTGGAGMLAEHPWPDEREMSYANEEADSEVGVLTEAIGRIRSMRSEVGASAGSRIGCVVVGSGGVEAWVGRHGEVLRRLGRLGEVGCGDAPRGWIGVPAGGWMVALDLARAVDLGAAGERLRRETAALGDEIAKMEARLGDTGFLSRAPEAVVEAHRERHDEARARRVRLEEALRHLEAAA